MTERSATTQARQALERALERSLRAGPTDEGGYRAEGLELSADAHAVARLGARAGRSPGVAGRPSARGIPVFASLDSVALLVATVFVGFLLLQGTILGGPRESPQPTPVATPSPVPVPPLTETFVSTRNGFSVRYPDGWSATAATSSWLPNTMLPFGNPALDEIKLDGVGRLVVASQRLQPGQTEASWFASYGQDYFLRRCSGDRAAWPRVTVDGRSGYLDLNGCPVPADEDFSSPDIVFQVLVFAGDRVYRIGLDGAIDRGYFDAILATVRLEPEAAIDPPETP